MNIVHFIGCGWCVLRVQGCRCTSPCGAQHCDAEVHNKLPAARRGVR